MMANNWTMQMQLKVMVLCTYDVPGCTDEAAINYNADANVDDGSCNYPTTATVEFAVDMNGVDQPSADYTK